MMLRLFSRGAPRGAQFASVTHTAFCSTGAVTAAVLRASVLRAPAAASLLVARMLVARLHSHSRLSGKPAARSPPPASSPASAAASVSASSSAPSSGLVPELKHLFGVRRRLEQLRQDFRSKGKDESKISFTTTYTDIQRDARQAVASLQRAVENDTLTMMPRQRATVLGILRDLQLFDLALPLFTAVMAQQDAHEQQHRQKGMTQKRISNKVWQLQQQEVCLLLHCVLRAKRALPGRKITSDTTPSTWLHSLRRAEQLLAMLHEPDMRGRAEWDASPWNELLQGYSYRAQWIRKDGAAAARKHADAARAIYDAMPQRDADSHFYMLTTLTRSGFEDDKDQMLQGLFNDSKTELNAAIMVLEFRRLGHAIALSSEFIEQGSATPQAQTLLAEADQRWAMVASQPTRLLDRDVVDAALALFKKAGDVARQFSLLEQALKLEMSLSRAPGSSKAGSLVEAKTVASVLRVASESAAPAEWRAQVDKLYQRTIQRVGLKTDVLQTAYEAYYACLGLPVPPVPSLSQAAPAALPAEAKSSNNAAPTLSSAAPPASPASPSSPAPPQDTPVAMNRVARKKAKLLLSPRHIVANKLINLPDDADPTQAQQLIDELQQAGEKLDAFVFDAWLSYCRNSHQVHEAERVWSLMREQQVEPTSSCYMRLIQTYIGSRGREHQAKINPLYAVMLKPDASFFAPSAPLSFTTDHFTHILTSAWHARQRDVYRVWIGHARRAGHFLKLSPELQQLAMEWTDPPAIIPAVARRQAVNALSKLTPAGDTDQARRVVEQLQADGVTPDVNVINAWLRVCLQRADWSEAERIWAALPSLSVKPSAYTFVHLINVYIATQSPEHLAKIDPLYAALRQDHHLRQNFDAVGFHSILHHAWETKQRALFDVWSERARQANRYEDMKLAPGVNFDDPGHWEQTSASSTVAESSSTDAPVSTDAPIGDVAIAANDGVKETEAAASTSDDAAMVHDDSRSAAASGR